AQLENTSGIARIEEEQFFPAPKPIGTFSHHAPQSFRALTSMDTPWGIDAVQAPAAWNVTRGNGIKVVVIDTGIDDTHPAIASRFVKGVNYMGGSLSDYSDEVGHGTHVAGTIVADG